MATNVYVDAFNLYYGSLKGTPYRWLDLGALCARLLPKDQINRIRYFTATVSARPDNPNAPQRQQVYLRALETIPDLSIHYGHYLSHVTRMPLANPPRSGPRTQPPKRLGGCPDSSDSADGLRVPPYRMTQGDGGSCRRCSSTAARFTGGSRCGVFRGSKPRRSRSAVESPAAFTTRSDR